MARKHRKPSAYSIFIAVLVVLLILAIALFISLITPSSAIVTRTMSAALTSCFGTGALLFPAGADPAARRAGRCGSIDTRPGC